MFRLGKTLKRTSVTPLRASYLSTFRIINIGSVVTPNLDGNKIEIIENSDLLISDGKICSLNDLNKFPNIPTLDAQQTMITPGFVDAHTHLFPPIDRANEFALRSVKSYKDIAAAGGGILSTVRSFREASLDEIVQANEPIMEQFFAQGTTTVEVKSGYGLTTSDEIKSLEAIHLLQQKFQKQLNIIPTFMGAHAVPMEYKGRVNEYVDLICQEMLPKVAELKLAEFCDVFCEEGYFNHHHTTKILEAAKNVGLKTRIHADEFVDSKGAETASLMGSYSADHLMAVSDAGVKAMAEKGVIPIVLPGATVFLGKGHGYAPMRKLLDGGCRLAIATDHNPGSSVHQSMAQMMQLSMANGGITLDEALLGATYNPAISLGLKDQVGTLQPGANADLILWNLQHPSQIPYYGCESRHRIYGIMKNGNFFENPSKRLWELHNTSTRSLRSHRTSAQQTLRHFSTTQTKPPSSTTATTATASPANGSKGLPMGTSQEIQNFLTNYLKINSFGQITSLPSTVDFTQPLAPSLDHTVPHAPKRLTRFTSEKETQLAITNALKYFHPSLHSILRPLCAMELETYGHIYFYHLLPPQHLWAIPYSDIPGKTMEAKAMTHMILNNLNPEVAQFPQELITYGGNGAVFGNWAQFHITIQMLNKMNSNQCLSMSSGHPQGLFPKSFSSSSSSDTPSAVISNGMMIPIYSTPEQLDRLYALGVSMYGQMTAGSWMYIGPQGIVHGTTLTVAQAIAMQAKQQSTTTPTTTSASPAAPTPTPSCRGKIFLTSGLGGMSGAQPKAATINGAICLIAEVDSSALLKRHQQGWLDEYYLTPKEVIDRAKVAQEKNESLSIGYLGNVIELWEYLAATPCHERCRITIGSDQTSLHNPYNGGYYPIGLSFEESNHMMVTNPKEFQKYIQMSLHRHLQAINSVRKSDQMLFFDYGNAFLLECHRAGCDVDADIPSYVECIMGPEFFDYGFGPYRWVCTSGDMKELEITDSIAAKVLEDQMNDPMNHEIIPQLRANHDWITSAMENNLVVGSKARILYSDLEGRIECAIQMNHAIANGLIKSPIVIGRDHHDVSGTDSPWRETSNIKDGSNLTADMSVQNVIGDAMRGATWVSLHNGGGTGWGVASNGGFGLVLDGTENAERRARNMIFFDVANGLTRRARAGNPHAMETIQRLAKKFPDYQPFVPSLEE